MDTSERKINTARKIALKKGLISNPEELQISKAKNKRFSVKIDNKTINFGVWPFSGEGTFIDHRNEKIRKAWRARHSKILKEGKPAYLNKLSPDYWAWHILWT
jgi:hypothetical protein